MPRSASIVAATIGFIPSRLAAVLAPIASSSFFQCGSPRSRRSEHFTHSIIFAIAGSVRSVSIAKVGAASSLSQIELGQPGLGVDADVDRAERVAGLAVLRDRPEQRPLQRILLRGLLDPGVGRRAWCGGAAHPLRRRGDRGLGGLRRGGRLLASDEADRGQEGHEQGALHEPCFSTRLVRALTDRPLDPTHDDEVRRRGAAAAIALVLLTASASAEDRALYERLWPEVPSGARLTLSQQITDQLTELGNTVGHHLDVLSNELVGLTLDGRRRRAKVRFGSTTSERYLTFSLAGDVHFTHGVARIAARIDVGIAGHVLALELPDFEMAPTSYRGERGVEIRLPLFKRTF